MENKDYTGGKKFFPWLFSHWQNISLVVIMVAELVGGVWAYFYSTGNNKAIAAILGFFFGVTLWQVIKDYNKLKRGDSS